MPKKELTDFQIELLQKRRDKARNKQEQDLRKRVFTLAVESDRERKLRIAVAKANKAFREQGPPPDSDNKSDSETDSQSSETSSQETTINHRKPFDIFEFILGIITGLLISLCIAFANATRHTQPNTPL